MKSKLNSPYPVYFFLILIALGITFLISHLFSDCFTPHRIQLQEDTRSIPRPNVLYHDFDHDGFSEMAALKYQKSIREAALKVYAYNGGLIDQWTFAEHWLPRSMIFGDYDHDGHDEVYVFTKNRDSLFLYAINPFRSHYILNRVFLLRAPQNVKYWDVRPIAGTFADSDNDGYADLIFNVMAGHALHPRRLYVYSIRKKRLLFASPRGTAFLAKPAAVQVNKSARILIRGCVATANGSPQKPFNDYAAWLTVFTPQLRFAFSPIPFKGKNVSLQAFPFGTDHQNIIALVIYGNKEQSCSDLLLYDWQGKLVKQKKLHGRDWDIFQSASNGENHTYLFNHVTGKLIFLSPEAEIVGQEFTDYPITGILETRFDLDGDFSAEWIGRSQNRLVIFTNFLREHYVLPIKNVNWDNLNYSLKKNGNAPPLLSVQTGEKKYLVKFSLNPWYPLHYFSNVILFILIFLLLWGLLSLINLFTSYRTILDSLLHNPDRGLMIINRKGKIRYINHTMIHQFRLDATNLKGKNIFQIFADFPSFLEQLKELLRTQQPLDTQISLIRNRISLQARVFGKPIAAALGYVTAYFVELNDYSKPIEDDRLKVWSKTVQKMAHDIKAPLSSININLTTLSLKLSKISPETHREIQPELNLMIKEVKRVKEKTINFLKFTNLEPPRLDWVDLKEVIGQTLQIFKSYAGRSIHFQLEFDPDLPKVYADAQQLKMALQALIENAIDALHGEGIIAISLSKVVDIQQNFLDMVEIEIADSGPGIPEDIRDKIFEPYFTTKRDGTGMGLAIARKIVLEHGGNLDIYSTENFATIIKITLPLYRSQPYYSHKGF
jgi:nitrogen-specific signal transduction histidine kinase